MEVRKVPLLFNKSAALVQQKCRACSTKVPRLLNKSIWFCSAKVYGFVQQKCHIGGKVTTPCLWDSWATVCASGA